MKHLDILKDFSDKLSLGQILSQEDTSLIKKAVSNANEKDLIDAFTYCLSKEN